MAIHLYKTSTPSTRNGTVDSQVKSNPRNNLIYGQHHCGKGRNARGTPEERSTEGMSHKILASMGQITLLGRVRVETKDLERPIRQNNSKDKEVSLISSCSLLISASRMENR
ncbi:ribosomal L2 [Olea europaea subsp. europaea]|uniref:Ribosomal L2 (Chloroplast) n=1 Tax=Olea europaea subsp. europaea TaxID=158383 RepID=A0A8S0PXY2_OLEEU|nr:ribosomal L2 [Olea europaea subsp. europaea]